MCILKRRRRGLGVRRYIHICLSCIFARCSSAPCSVLCLYFCLLAADAALKEEHVIDGRTIDVKRAVPRDRAPLPRLVRVMRVGFPGRVGDWHKPGLASSDPRVLYFLGSEDESTPPLHAFCCLLKALLPLLRMRPLFLTVYGVSFTVCLECDGILRSRTVVRCIHDHR